MVNKAMSCGPLMLGAISGGQHNVAMVNIKRPIAGANWSIKHTNRRSTLKRRYLTSSLDILAASQWKSNMAQDREFRGIGLHEPRPSPPPMTATEELATRFDNLSASGALPDSRPVHNELANLFSDAAGLHLLVNITNNKLARVEKALENKDTAGLPNLGQVICNAIKAITEERGGHEVDLSQLKKDAKDTGTSLENYLKQHGLILGEGSVAYVTQEIARLEPMIAEIQKSLEDLKLRLDQVVKDFYG